MQLASEILLLPCEQGRSESSPSNWLVRPRRQRWSETFARDFNDVKRECGVVGRDGMRARVRSPFARAYICPLGWARTPLRFVRRWQRILESVTEASGAGMRWMIKARFQPSLSGAAVPFRGRQTHHET